MSDYYCYCCGRYLPGYEMYDESLCRRCRSEYGVAADAFDIDEETARDNWYEADIDED